MAENRSSAVRRVLSRIEKRVRAQYSNDTEFHRACLGDALSYASVRRAWDPKLSPPTTETVLILAQAAGFNHEDIREMLKEMGDLWLHRLIGSPAAESFSLPELGLIDAVRKITSAEPKYWGNVVNTVALLAEAARVDISAELAAMKSAA